MTKNKKINLMMMTVFIFMNFVLSMSSTLFNGILDKMVVDLNVSLSKVGYHFMLLEQELVFHFF